MAYAYKIEDDFRTGIPQTAFLNGAGPFRGISCHWTAGAPGYNGAKGTINFLVNNASRNASYHEIWWWENKTFGVIRIVRPDRASHSMNPTPPTWAPNALVKRILGDKVGDPNRYAYSVSFAGMPADMDKACADPDFLAAATRRTKELYAQFGSLSTDPLFNHGEGQPTTRYDWGTKLRPEIYKRLGADMVNEYIKRMDKTRLGWTVKLGAGATARTLPIFNRFNYDDYKITTRTTASSQRVIGMVKGSNLTLADGTVFDPRTDWVITDSGSSGIVFWHIRDATEFIDPLAKQTEVIAGLQTQLNVANTRLTRKDAKADELKAV